MPTIDWLGKVTAALSSPPSTIANESAAGWIRQSLAAGT